MNHSEEFGDSDQKQAVYSDQPLANEWLILVVDVALPHGPNDPRPKVRRCPRARASLG